MPNAFTIIQFIASTLLSVTHAATASVSKVLMDVVMMMLDTAYMIDCRPVGRPIRIV